ncbi:DUF302 domain-containing protein (plasmid) [Haloferacaceae archaeon DSL9]
MTQTDPDRHRRRLLQLVGLSAGGAIAGAAGVGMAAESDEAGHDDRRDDAPSIDDSGLVTVESEQDFETTVDAITGRIEDSPLTLLSTVDHAANAESVGRDLPPTTLLLFGNPDIGTQLMQDSRSVAIDLPQKILVWCADGAVNVTYNDPQYLDDRHGLDGRGDLFEQIAGALQSVATGDDPSDE